MYTAKDTTLPQQITYLLLLIEIISVGQRRRGTYKDLSNSRRQHTLVFMIPDTAVSFVRMCQKLFMEMFRITSQTVQIIAKLRKQGELHTLNNVEEFEPKYTRTMIAI